jgi:hypothetical protein
MDDDKSLIPPGMRSVIKDYGIGEGTRIRIGEEETGWHRQYRNRLGRFNEQGM